MRFAELRRWDVAGFIEVGWHWPAETLKPLGTALSRVIDEFPSSTPKRDIPIIDKISFGGELTISAPDGRETYKGRLFRAVHGQLIYSKIRVKQGSVCIVPNNIPLVGVSAEYPVYDINGEVALDAYLNLVLRASSFQAKLDGLAHGGATKTRIHPDQFEALTVPLPSLITQRAIVAQWQDEQSKAAALENEARNIESEANAAFLHGLGLNAPANQMRRRCFAVRRSEAERWGLEWHQQRLGGTNLDVGKFPAVPLNDVLTGVQYGTSDKANTENRGVPVLRMSNIVDGRIDLSDLKHVVLSESDIRRWRLDVNDILFNRTNSKELVGKCAVFDDPILAVFASYLIRVKVDSSLVIPHFVTAVLNGPIGRRQIDAVSRQIIGQANINSKELSALRIPLPPLDVQSKLVEALRAARMRADTLRAQAVKHRDSSRAEVEAMILGKRPVPSFRIAAVL